MRVSGTKSDANYGIYLQNTIYCMLTVNTFFSTFLSTVYQCITQYNKLNISNIHPRYVVWYTSWLAVLFLLCELNFRCVEFQEWGDSNTCHFYIV